MNYKRQGQGEPKPFGTPILPDALDVSYGAVLSACPVGFGDRLNVFDIVR